MTVPKNTSPCSRFKSYTKRTNAIRVNHTYSEHCYIYSRFFVPDNTTKEQKKREIKEKQKNKGPRVKLCIHMFTGILIEEKPHPMPAQQ